MSGEGLAIVRASIATHGKSFSFAGRVLPSALRDDSAALYAFCRRADDAVDDGPGRGDVAIVDRLERELASVYAGEAQRDPVLSAFQAVAHRHGIPREYPEELLAGMRMDAEGAEYETTGELLCYCYRVAGTVGLMMSHVLGVRDAVALRHAAHLGMAMQLTNVCRDVREDFERNRLYVPYELLEGPSKHALVGRSGPLPGESRDALAKAMLELLDLADAFYASGERGIPYLPARAGLAVRTARLVYADIGRVIRSRGADPFAPRAVVSMPRKLALALVALSRTLLEPTRAPRQDAPSCVIGVNDVVSL